MGLHKGQAPKNLKLFISGGIKNRFKKGSIPWSQGKHLPDSVKFKIGLAKKGQPSSKKGKKYMYKERTYKICPTCKKSFTDFPYRMNVQKYCSTKCANKIITPSRALQREKIGIIANHIKEENCQKILSKIYQKQK